MGDQAAAAVVDVDLHLAETPADLARHCDMPWRRVLEEPDRVPPWQSGGSPHPRLAQRPEPPTPARTPAELEDRLGALGVDLAVALPGPLLKLGVLPTGDYAAALARAYNRWLVAAWLDHADGLYGAVIAAPQDPEDAAREVELHAGHERVVAALLPMAGTDPPCGDRRYDPIYAAAEAAELPVVLHGGGGLLLPASPYQGSPFLSEFEQVGVSQPLVAMANLVHMVGTGVLARFPRLRVVFLEAGVSWLAHMVLRMDKEYSENRRDVPFYTDRVSLSIRRQVWVGTQPVEDAAGPGTFEELIGISCGIDRVLYGSHWPDAHFDTPERVAAALASDESRRRVLGANALELFGKIQAKERSTV